MGLRDWFAGRKHAALVREGRRQIASGLNAYTDHALGLINLYRQREEKFGTPFSWETVASVHHEAFQRAWRDSGDAFGYMAVDAKRALLRRLVTALEVDWIAFESFLERRDAATAHLDPFSPEAARTVSHSELAPLAQERVRLPAARVIAKRLRVPLGE